MRRILLGGVLLSFLLMGCSSYFKRKSCEKVNWHDHGYKVAMQGKRLTGDGLYESCQKVEAKINHSDVDLGWKEGAKKYCSPSGALEKGRSGELFSLDFCDKTENSKTHKAYKKGIKEFCQKGKAYAFGAKGGVYKNVCTEKQEVAWMPEYNRGRKVYLEGEIRNKRSQIRDIDNEVIDYENERRDVLNQIALLPSGKVATTERQYNPDTKKYTEVTKVSEDEETKNKRRDLKWDLDRVSRKIKEARKRQKGLRAEINNLQKEIRALN